MKQSTKREIVESAEERAIAKDSLISNLRSDSEAYYHSKTHNEGSSIHALGLSLLWSLSDTKRCNFGKIMMMAPLMWFSGPDVSRQQRVPLSYRRMFHLLYSFAAQIVERDFFLLCTVSPTYQ